MNKPLKFLDIAPALGVIIAVIALGIVLIAGIMAVFFETQPLYDVFMGNPAANVGIPASAFAAFVIVSVLWHVFPPDKSSNGPVQLKFFGMEFTGPAGPISLWIACFLSLILAVNQLKLDRPPVAAAAASAAVPASSQH